MKLEDLKKLCDAATPGPWTVLDDTHGAGWINEPRMGYEGELPIDDVRLIVAARNALPKLIAVAEAARALLPCHDITESEAEGRLVDALDALEGDA